MESVYFINLIFIFVVNVFFFFSGVCLNSVVIISFWRSVQLRKKLCYFMIMVLSCCDLLAVLINNPLLAAIAMLLLTGRLDVNSTWPSVSMRSTFAFFIISLLALLVMNFDRYLATSYPLFHRTSVTKGRLLTFLGILIIIEVTLAAMSVNKVIISFKFQFLIFFSLLTPLFFINYKLFLVVRSNRRNNGISRERKRRFSVTNISSCLLVFVCYVALFIPVLVNIGIKANSSDAVLAVGKVHITGIWSRTISSINATLNCLIFYWKNKVLRSEGWKVIKSIKIWRGVQS